MLVKFLNDFRGRETGEVFYCAGEVADVNVEMAERLVNQGRAELLSAELPAAVADKKPVVTPVQPKRGRHK
jgi:hypothetical protein